MPKHTLYVVTYERAPHPLTRQPRPRHWAFFLEPPNTPGDTRPYSPKDAANPRGIILQLRGMPGGFYYPGPEQLDMSQGGEPGWLFERLEVGEVDEGDIAAVHETLAAVDVVKDESAGWNCQDWAMAGVDKLREAGKGWIHDKITGEGVYAFLGENHSEGWDRSMV